MTTGYGGPEYFCDREKETDALTEAFDNGRNVTLFSPRRLGKTGLIRHFFYTLSQRKRGDKPITIYLDIQDTTDLNGFINAFASTVIHALESKQEAIFKRMSELFRGLKVQFTMNEYSGIPEVNLGLETPDEKERSVASVFQYLKQQKKPVVIAIDEFQQINEYPEQNTEALLRKYIQHQQNIRYIFSGSEKHLLLPIFSDSNRPFYQSTQFLQLKKLDHAPYAEFIKKGFQTGNKTISDDAIELILQWSCYHTYYTQYVCNILFARSDKKVSTESVKKVIPLILEEHEPVFQYYRKLLHTQQFKLLTAIAKENEATELTGSHFLHKYDLTGTSTVLKSLNTLIEKSLVFEEKTSNKTHYRLNDVFLMRWLEQLK